MRSLNILLLSVLCGNLSAAELEIRPQEKIVLLGATFIERAQVFGYLETALVERTCGKQIRVRNLGWSGDNVWGHSRSGFDPPQAGFAQLMKHVREAEPTLIFVAYGANEAFAGEAGLAAFEQGYNHLLDELATTKARLVLVTPHRQEMLGPPLPDPADYNHKLADYVQVIRQIAQARDLPLVDLFRSLDLSTDEPAITPLTGNGLHLTAAGYRQAALAFEQQLGFPRRDWKVAWDAKNRKIKTSGTQVLSIDQDPSGLSFQLRDHLLPLGSGERKIHISGLEAGSYTLKIDGQPVQTATATQWADGQLLEGGQPIDQAEQLRQAIVNKNELYFYRWRPQNITYLFGFRRHEQGQNAKEIPQFDPLIAQQEQQIEKLCRPVAYKVELVQTSGGSK